MVLLLSHFSLLSLSAASSSSSPSSIPIAAASSSSSSPSSIPIAAASSSSIPLAAATFLSKIPQKSLIFQNRSFNGIGTSSPTYAKRSVIVRASSEIDGKDGECKPDALPPLQGSEEAVVPVENLPLESKQKEMMEQRLRMKLAKKIRLRRKRLLRKRKTRKKGRWLPSKMKKLKNV